jgi:hypothetical protein
MQPQRCPLGTDRIVDPAGLLDISHFISPVIMELQEFFDLGRPLPPAQAIGMEGQG